MSNLDDDSDITLVSSPIGRYAKPEEVAQMAVVLVSGWDERSSEILFL